MLDISLLGTGGMLPLHNRYLTAMLARCNGRMLLIDCGEGTQVTMRELGWGFNNLDYILLTHLHADHVSGLPGLLLSLGNYGRSEAITIVGPNGTESVVNSLRVIAPELMYAIKFIELPVETQNPSDLLLGDFHVSALPLRHSLPCLGYSVSIPRAGKFDAERAVSLGIPVELWSKLQSGEAAGRFTPDMVLGPKRKDLKLSYITDTRPIETIPEFIRGSDLFICEGIYGGDEMREKAERYYHMIFSEAAELAKAGAVKELWLTHFSQALTTPEMYIPAARKIFNNTVAGRDRMKKTLVFED